MPAANANGATSFCEGGSVELTTSMAAGANGVQWLKGNVIITGANSLTYTATTTGLYAAQFLNNNVPIAGTNTTVATSVTVNPLPTATITSSNSAAVCAGTAVTLTATSNATTPTYEWYDNGNIITGATSGVYSTTSSGVFSYKVIDGNTSCSAGSATSTVSIVTPPAAPNLTATASTICVNNFADLTLYQPQALSGVSYEWHSAANTLSTTLVANPANVNAAGAYYLFAKNNTAGCYSSASVAFNLTVTTVAALTITKPLNISKYLFSP